MLITPSTSISCRLVPLVSIPMHAVNSLACSPSPTKFMGNPADRPGLHVWTLHRIRLEDGTACH